MKTISMLIISSVLSLSVFAGNGPGNNNPDYCAKVRDGKKVVMHEGTVLTSEATLNNGATLKTDGTIVKPDGDKENLKLGECISKDGSVTDKKGKDKDQDKDRDLDRDKYKDRDMDRDKKDGDKDVPPY